MSGCDGRQKIHQRGRNTRWQGNAREDRIYAVWTNPLKFGRARF
jgi:hypothetical protein